MPTLSVKAYTHSFLHVTAEIAGMDSDDRQEFTDGLKLPDAVN